MGMRCISVVMDGSVEIEYPYMEVDGVGVPCSFSNGEITAHVDLDELNPWHTGNKHIVVILANNCVLDVRNDNIDK